MKIFRRQVPYVDDVAALIPYLDARHSGYDPSTLMLLESADIETRQGLTSIAILRASVRATCEGQSVTLEPLTSSGRVIATKVLEELADQAHVEGNVATFEASTDVDERARLLATSTVEPLRRLLALDFGDAEPWVGGTFAYDYVATFEDLPGVADSTNTCPDYQFVLGEVVLLVDHTARSAELIQVDAAGSGSNVDEMAAALEHSQAACEAARAARAGRGEIGANAPEAAGATSPDGVVTAQADISDAGYRQIVAEMKDAIYRGDIYQAVPARTFTLPCPDAPAAYAKLKESNASPYMFFQRGLGRDGKPFELFGASPESNLKFDAATREVELYPIAGTRPRGRDTDGYISHELDIRAELDMRTDAKELAEHTMLVDLARNDLARVATPGTRKVAALLQVDRYSHVMHLVSRVTARLADGMDALDAYRACMNMGTLTGAPKIKATQLLRAQEKRRRGSYGGAIGYLRGDGSMDTCIVIRSAFVAGGVAAVQAGAGVVRDSNPQSEADETLHKARAVLEAIARAQGKKLEVER